MGILCLSDGERMMQSDTIMSSRLQNSITVKKEELDRNRPFPGAVVKKLEEEFLLEWTYNSNAIEGNTLSLRETELVLNRGLTIGGKSLREHFEVINHAEAIKYLESFIEKKTDLSDDFICGLHRRILHNIDELEAGVYRRHNVRIMGANHLPPAAAKVQRLMDDLVDWYTRNVETMWVPDLAAEFHHRFVHVHPFMDGNGRTARLLMNFILMQDGYPPAVVLRVDRKKYYRVLQEADGGNLVPFVDFIGRSIERSLIIYLNAIKPSDEHESGGGYISLHEATQYCDYSQEYLSLLARTGKLDAVKFGRNWMTSREAIETYIELVKFERKE